MLTCMLHSDETFAQRWAERHTRRSLQPRARPPRRIASARWVHAAVGYRSRLCVVCMIPLDEPFCVVCSALTHTADDYVAVCDGLASARREVALRWRGHHLAGPRRDMTILSLVSLLSSFFLSFVSCLAPDTSDSCALPRRLWLLCVMCMSARPNE